MFTSIYVSDIIEIDTNIGDLYIQKYRDDGILVFENIDKRVCRAKKSTSSFFVEERRQKN
jgi:hypothetical protein